MKLTFLGTGTSTGVPQVGCRCSVCTSTDPHDSRLRASALVDTGSGRILIDCGPDLRAQMLAIGAPAIDAVLVTHSHYDHVGGIDDLRPQCAMLPDYRMPVYCRADVDRDLRARVPYCFAEHPYPGVPRFDMHVVEEYSPFTVAGVEVTPIPVKHFKLDILGYRIGRSLAYITDCKTITPRAIDALRGVDTLVINALRTDEHMSHMTLAQALQVVDEIKPRTAWLTHMSHQIGLHSQVNGSLPDGVRLAHDGLSVEVPDAVY